MNAQDLISEHFKLKDFLDAESKRFEEHVKPLKTRMEEIANLLLALLNQTGGESIKTDYGTAYKSTIVSPKITDRDKYLDFVLDKWGEGGNEMLQLGAPQKDAVKTWLEEHEGQLPPGVDQSSFTRVNIRRS